MNGSQQICFTDSAGKALFSIPDNGLLCLFYGNGDRHFAVCHRLDDTHAEIDGTSVFVAGKLNSVLVSILLIAIGVVMLIVAIIFYFLKKK